MSSGVGVQDQGEGYGEDYPLPSRLGGLGEHREAPTGVWLRAPSENNFRGVLGVLECSCW